MALASTQEAIGDVTSSLVNWLAAQSGVTNVEAGNPQAATESGDGPKLNLFLYRLELDPYLKNQPLDEGRPAPLWLVLHYLLTAYDESRQSDSIEAHKLLSKGMRTLQALNISWPSLPSLLDNPEPLKITFDSADVDLLSKVMQGSEESYRIAAAFQVRPVLIATDETPSYAPAVLSVGPPATPGVVVLPSMGPQLKSVAPERFESGALLRLSGSDINTTIDEVQFGPLVLPVIAAREGEVQARLPAIPGMSAGTYPISVSRTLPSGRRMSSNPLAATLMPTVATATVNTPLTPQGSKFSGSLSITGQRLGGPDDQIFVSFYRDGKVQLSLEVTGSNAQNALAVTVPPARAIAAGIYYLIVRVNGAQAAQIQSVDWS